MQRELWGTNTTVDFEHALAGAINKIRDALGENPRLIQTLPRRGYRFIAPVTPVTPPAQEPKSLPVEERPILPDSAITPVEPPAVPSPPLADRDAGTVAPSRAQERVSKQGWLVPQPVFLALVSAFLLASALAPGLWLSQPETATVACGAAYPHGCDLVRTAKPGKSADAGN